ncbi:hypothetical protein HRbin24_00095 [bacterium HR24]|nr:hypothetical protein HRbin24_00095 [bacterium HR24]
MKWIVWAESTCYVCRQTAGTTWHARALAKGRNVYRPSSPCATAPVVVEAETRREAIQWAKEGRLAKFA